METKRILAIDPGNTESAFVLMDGYSPLQFGKIQNADLLNMIQNTDEWERTVIEMVACYGMPVGREVFETCVWIGRFSMASELTERPVDYIYRMEEKMAICHDSKAKDSNIRQGLVDRFAQHDFKSGKGTKKNPDYFYGFFKDVWSAFAVGFAYLDKNGKKVEERG